MIHFTDGPAEGHTLALRRAPRWLRVVIDPAGKVDALDQLDDEPADDELVHVYRLVEDSPEAVFFCGRGRGALSGRYMIGTYRHYALGLDALARIRDRDAWHAWVGEVEGERIDPATGCAFEPRGPRAAAGTAAPAHVPAEASR